MSADAETTQILNAISNLDTKIERSAAEGRVSVERVHQRINKLAEVTQNGFTEVARSTGHLEAKVSAHHKEDDRRFSEQGEAIKEGVKDRKGLLAIILGGSAGGGVVAGLIEVLTRKGP